MSSVEFYLKAVGERTTELREFIRWLNCAAVPTGDNEDEATEAILQMVQEIRLTTQEFCFLDEKPGWFGMGYPSPCKWTGKGDGAWHRKLRIVRNGNNDLFDLLVQNRETR
jgi:hypothetical protein